MLNHPRGLLHLIHSIKQMELAPIRQEETEVSPETRQLLKPVRTFISPCLQGTLDTCLYLFLPQTCGH